MQFKVWLVCKHLSCLRKQLKDPVEVYRTQSTVVALALSLSQHQNGKKIMRVRKKEQGDWRKNGSDNREPKSGHYLVKSGVRLMSTREQWLAKQRMAVSRNDPTFVFGEVFKTSLTSRNSCNVRFAILLTLGCTWPTILKACATPTNSNAHVTSRFKGHWECTQGIHSKYAHLVVYIHVHITCISPYKELCGADSFLWSSRSSLASIRSLKLFITQMCVAGWGELCWSYAHAME